MTDTTEENVCCLYYIVGISQEMVNQKFVEIEVCITQKYTRKSFIIATWNMPVSMATRKLRKERYPLRPCISTNVPSNMRVYNGSDMDPRKTEMGVEHSQSMTSLDNWATPYPPSQVYTVTTIPFHTTILLWLYTTMVD